MDSSTSIVKFIINHHKPIAILVGVGALTTLKLKSIYVPECIEDARTYKFGILFIDLFKKCAKWANKLRLGNEAIVFRYLLHKLIDLSRGRRQKSLMERYRNITIKEAKVNGTPIRVYSLDYYGSEQNNNNIQAENINGIEQANIPLMFYFHGGANVIGKSEYYDSFLVDLIESLRIIVIAIDYKLAPEFFFPEPITECHEVILNLIQNRAQFKEFDLSRIDLNRIILAGDSAGANIATVLAIRFKKEQQPALGFSTKIQLLINPLTQYFNFQLPSSIRYSNLESVYTRAKCVLWHMGFRKVTRQMEEMLINNVHHNLLDQHDLDNYRSLVNVDLIDDKYKPDEIRFDYDNYPALNDSVYPTNPKANPMILALNAKNRVIFDEMIRNHKMLKTRLMNLFNVNVSPCLADDSELAGLPQAYFAICGHDCRKDEGLIYAERLNRLNKNVHIDYYENAIHGSLNLPNNKLSMLMQNNIINYLKCHL